MCRLCYKEEKKTIENMWNKELLKGDQREIKYKKKMKTGEENRIKDLLIVSCL